MYVHFHAFSGRRTVTQSTEIPKAMHIQNVAAHPTFPETLTAASSSLRPSVCLQLCRRNTSLTSQTVFFLSSSFPWRVREGNRGACVCAHARRERENKIADTFLCPSSLTFLEERQEDLDQEHDVFPSFALLNNWWKAKKI